MSVGRRQAWEMLACKKQQTYLKEQQNLKDTNAGMTLAQTQLQGLRIKTLIRNKDCSEILKLQFAVDKLMHAASQNQENIGSYMYAGQVFHLEAVSTATAHCKAESNQTFDGTLISVFRTLYHNFRDMPHFEHAIS